MIKKKICMLGSFAVGKTSLVQQYVNSIFSEKYHTTIGVKIDKKPVAIDEKEVNLLLWDIHGEDEYQKIQASYLTGTSGYFIVVDGTRGNTLEIGISIQKLAEESVGKKPFVLLVNKSDLADSWDIDENEISRLSVEGWNVIRTSAKTGQGVEEAFVNLTRAMLEI